MNDVITRVQEEKTGVRVTVNEEEAFWLSNAVYRERPLQEGDALDVDEFREWLLQRQYPEALNKAVAFLATRARSALEVRGKLESKNYMEQTIDLVLFKLEKEGIVDDGAFARDWARARSHRQLGKDRIVMELRQKGIKKELALAAVAELDEGETDEQAEALALKLLRRQKSETDPRKALQKVLAAMARRGYAYGEASRAVEAALKELREEDGTD